MELDDFKRIFIPTRVAIMDNTIWYVTMVVLALLTVDWMFKGTVFGDKSTHHDAHSSKLRASIFNPDRCPRPRPRGRSDGPWREGPRTPGVRVGEKVFSLNKR
jgi:hypothetical protein